MTLAPASLGAASVFVTGISREEQFARGLLPRVELRRRNRLHGAVLAAIQRLAPTAQRATQGRALLLIVPVMQVLAIVGYFLANRRFLREIVTADCARVDA